ncbi:hypothetical protein [Levilactobacillus zymae]|uniref:hypothetical protein n=1 Tax=Levilactobacillus zymae TaxID=267363 RepID=UPI0028B886F9|nr:hypothetical protein [Levilactobacillus zymae]MDT6979465.1 hypothetical protein [Levilactobacillus zymae]
MITSIEGRSFDTLTPSETQTTLQEIGFSKTWITQFLQLPRAQQAQRLNEERSATLAQLHVAQDQLDRLDYLRYQLIDERTH